MKDMLATSRQSIPAQEQGTQLLTRVFADRFGRQFRMTFLVAVVDGELHGRLISAEPISESLQLHGEVASHIVCLPITISKKEVKTPYVFNAAPIISPFSSIEFLIHSQPTRAPSRS